MEKTLEQIEKLEKSRALLFDGLRACITILSSDKEFGADFESTLKAANFYFGQIKEVDFAITRLKIETEPNKE